MERILFSENDFRPEDRWDDGMDNSWDNRGDNRIGGRRNNRGGGYSRGGRGGRRDNQFGGNRDSNNRGNNNNNFGFRRNNYPGEQDSRPFFNQDREPQDSKKEKNGPNQQNQDDLKRKIAELEANPLFSPEEKANILAILRLDIKEEVKNEKKEKYAFRYDSKLAEVMQHVENQKKELIKQIEAISAKTRLREYDNLQKKTCEARLEDQLAIDEVFNERYEMLKKKFLENPCGEIESKMVAEINRLRNSLPVYAKYHEIKKAVSEGQFILLVGETGCGKSTQVPQYLHDFKEEFWGHKKKKVICTQPRKLAAKSLAERVAEEMGENRLGRTVDYMPSLWDDVSKTADLLFTTDRTLMDLLMEKNSLEEFGAILVDEAHERNIQTDLLLAYLKQKAVEFPDLKVIVCSATIDKEEFFKFFNHLALIEIPGRTFPIETIYHRRMNIKNDALDIECIIKDYASGKYNRSGEKPGDILVFMPNIMEINKTMKYLEKTLANWWVEEDGALIEKEEEMKSQEFAGFESKRQKENKFKYVIYPLHGAVTYKEQKAAINPSYSGMTKIVLATRIAETSITIDGIKVVIDTGLEEDVSRSPVLISLLDVNEC